MAQLVQGPWRESYADEAWCCDMIVQGRSDRLIGWLCRVLGALAVLAAPMPVLAANEVPIAVERFDATITDADVPALLRGAFDGALRAQSPAAVTPRPGHTTWYRPRPLAEWVSPEAPVLVISQANDMVVRVYQSPDSPGAQYSIYRADNTRGYSRRVLLVPLDHGWKANSPVYLRVDASTAVAHAFWVTDRESAHVAEVVQARSDVVWPLVQLAFLLAALVTVRTLPDRASLLYMGLCASIALATAYKSGLGFEYWPLSSMAALGIRANVAAALVTAACALALARELLDLGRRAPWLSRGFAGGSVLLLACALMAALPLPGTPVVMLGATLVLAALWSLWMAGAWCAWQRQRNAGLFVLAWTPAVLLFTVRVAQIVAQVPSPRSFGLLQSITFACASLGMLAVLARRSLNLALPRAGDVALRERDVLTGTLSRSAGFAHLRAAFIHARSQRQELSLLTCDLAPELRARASASGRSELDACLCEVAAMLREAVPRGEVLARCYDDQLVALLPRRGAAQAQAIAQDLAARIAHVPVQLGGVTLATALAVGTATLDDGMRTPDELLSRAVADGEAAHAQRRRAAMPERPGA